jgi:alkyl sulfatase BDS1-like metallo-beta-lactamase superfamily hydrolase
VASDDRTNQAPTGTDTGRVPQEATFHTIAVNKAAGRRSPDPADLERVRRGHVASLSESVITSPEGRRVFDVGAYEFLRKGAPAPETVNPNLWRHAVLNAHHGLFKVVDGVWQVRGYDISNITFIRGETGWIVIDPLTSEHTARASLGLINEHVEQRPVTAVIYTHSHADHFGGVLGVTNRAEVDAGRCRIIAPEHFMRETIGENVIAGPAMARRATYQFGPMLPPGPRGHVDCGLGNSVPVSPPTLLAPTEDIIRTGQELVVDGVRVIFQLTPETEAPAEMNFYFPDLKALCMAENCSHTMHNLVPIRGALVRNALNWSKYINESIQLFGADADVLFASHNWPRWGNQDLHEFLVLQRDLYKWMHDQTMRLANKGHTPLEIAEELVLPEEFQRHEHTRGFYGDLVHNSKAVYQRYLSWYDGNPANLHKLPPAEAGRRYVDLAGGAAALLQQAHDAFNRGDYRWVAEIVNHLVFAEPTNQAARSLQARALEQLGYQSESATFRNAYLMGAMELRQGPPANPNPNVRARALVREMTVDQVFDTIAVRTMSENLGGVSLATNWTFTDLAGTPDERWVLGVSNRTMYSTRGTHAPDAVVSLTLTRAKFLDIVLQDTTFVDAVKAGDVVLSGDAASLITIFGNLDTFSMGFPIVEP